ncbi:MAG: hypothetical protein ACK4PK_09315 [Alphaproteobacteria bacterium]
MFYLLRLLAALAICGSFAMQMIGTLWRGFKTGKMPHSDSTSFADRRKQPLFFWFLAALFGFFVLGAIYIIYLALVSPTREMFGALESR